MLDEDLLNEQIAELDCMKNMAAPSDARILYKEGEGYILIPEKEGSKVNIDDAAALIDTAIRGGESSVDISECYEEPKIRESDLKEKYEALKKFQDIIITYDFGDRTETLDIHRRFSVPAVGNCKTRNYPCACILFLGAEEKGTPSWRKVVCF